MEKQLKNRLDDYTDEKVLKIPGLSMMEHLTLRIAVVKAIVWTCDCGDFPILLSSKTLIGIIDKIFQELEQTGFVDNLTQSRGRQTTISFIRENVYQPSLTMVRSQLYKICDSN